MKKWLLAGGMFNLLLAVGMVIGIMWLLGIQIEWPNGASRTLASSKPGRAAYTDMAYSHDWQTMALGTLRHGAQVWNIKDDKMLYDTEPGRVQTVAISPDGQMLALFWKSVDEKAHKVELRRLSDGTLVRTMEEQEEWVSSVAFSSDGQTLAVGSSDKVQLFDVIDGKLLHTMIGPGWEVAFSPDGKLVAAGGVPIKVWRVAAGELLYTVEGWHYMEFSPDSEMLATAASVNGENINLWDMSTGTLLDTLEPPTSNAGQIHSLAFSPDGEILAASTNRNTVDLWLVSTSNLERTIRLGTNNNGEGVAFSPDGNTLSVQMSYRVQWWPIEKLKYGPQTK